MFQYLVSNLASSDLAGDLAAMGFYMSETIITSHTHARLLLARTHVRQTRAGKGTRELWWGVPSQATPPGGALLSKGQSWKSTGGHAMRGIIHYPKPTAHSQTYRTGEPRARHHHPPSLSPAVSTCGIDEFGSRVRYSLKVLPPTAPSRKSFHQGGVRGGGEYCS